MELYQRVETERTKQTAGGEQYIVGKVDYVRDPQAEATVEAWEKVTRLPVGCQLTHPDPDWWEVWSENTASWDCDNSKLLGKGVTAGAAIADALEQEAQHDAG